MSKTATASIKFETVKSMPAAKRRQVISKLPVEEQRRFRAEEARSFEAEQKAQKSRWERAKGAVKSAASKVAGFFKRAATKVASVAKSTATTVASVAKTAARHVVAFVMAPIASIRARQLIMPSWMWRIVDGVKAAGLYVARNWAAILCGFIYIAALVVAPVTTLIATALCGLAYATTRASNSFVAHVVAETLIRMAADIFVIGFFASAERR